jgi:hypothetical protein
MASWITIYLQHPLENLDIHDIKQGIGSADWWTLGEDFGVEEEEVDKFMEGLYWQNDPLEIGQEGSRPIQIHIWREPSRLKEEIAEISEKKLPGAVSEHLKNIHTIVALELGISQLRTMYEVVAFEIAYWLAETKQGLICSPDDLWFDHDKHRWQAIQ